jgi:phytoene synthase
MRPRSKFSNEQLFCWEQIAKTNRFFRVSHAFAPPVHAKKLLPLYALFSVMEEASSAYSDENLARSKLAWWRQEIFGRDPGTGSHPVIRELHRHVRLGDREEGRIARLIEDAESRLDDAPPVSIDELQRRCERVSEPQLELEMGLCDVDEPFPGALEGGHGARLGLIQLMRESIRRRGDGAWWWLPLDMSARHGVTRAEVAGVAAGDRARTLFAELLENAQGWAGVLPPEPDVPRLAGVPRHLQVVVSLQSGLLSRLLASHPERFEVELSRTTLGDLFRAWRAARRFSRP